MKNKKGGRPKALTEAYERALIEYLRNVENSTFAVTEACIRTYVSSISQFGLGGPESRLSQAWVSRFKKRDPELQYNNPKLKDITRASAEYDMPRLEGRFNGFEGTVESEDIEGQNLWNSDKTPLQTGWVNGSPKYSQLV